MNRVCEQVAFGIASAVLLMLLALCFVIFFATGFIAEAAYKSFEFLTDLIEDINQ